MNNNFAEEFKKEQEIKAAYRAADNEEGREKARADYQTWKQGIIDKGEDYGKVYKFYSDAHEVGNDYIEISETYEYQDEKELIDLLREYGITEFAFTSTWSSAVKSAWIFQQNGCTVEGMVEINAHTKAWMSDEYEKKQGFLFRIH